MRNHKLNFIVRKLKNYFLLIDKSHSNWSSVSVYSTSFCFIVKKKTAYSKLPFFLFVLIL